MQARSAVQCRSARESAAVSPANNATFPIGSIVVHSVAKSLLILINRGDIVFLPSERFILIPTAYQARPKLLSQHRTIEHSDSTLHVSLRCRGESGTSSWKPTGHAIALASAEAFATAAPGEGQPYLPL